jgi:hypothetical protein
VTTAIAAPIPSTDVTEHLGRLALATQGVLYVVVGLIAASLARGDHSPGEEASQRGAIESVARQPFGRVLLVLLLGGLAAHGAWRLLLAIRGEPGTDDGKSVVKRLAHGGRAMIYASLAWAAYQLLTTSSPSGDGNREQESTAMVLGWPAGQWLVMVAGLAVIGVGLWHMSKVVTAAFLDSLDLSGLDDRKRTLVEGAGRAGYLARGAAFGLVGWFLLAAGLQHDPNEVKGLDASLRELLARPHGPWLLGGLALGLGLFGLYRLLDARFRKPSDIVYS